MSIGPWPSVVLAFFGALLFSLWNGRLALCVDVRDHGDHNPGATNVLRAAMFAWRQRADLAHRLHIAPRWRHSAVP